MNVRRPSLVLSALLLVSAGSLASAQQSPMPGCNGLQNVVRISEIKPGMMEKFKEAVAAQKAWYKHAGTADEIVLMTIMDSKTGAWSTTEAITQHKVAGTPPPHDAGFQAFVDLFQASSTIKTQYITCEQK